MINVKVENLGIIKEANLSLKPLTVFIGENNTNKSWLAYSIFGIFSQKLRFPLAQALMEREEEFPLGEIVFSIVEDAISKGYKEIKDFPKFLKENLNLFLASLSTLFRRTASQFFSVDSRILKGFNIEVSIPDETIEDLCSEFLKLPIESVFSLRIDKTAFYKSGENLIMEVDKSEDFPSSLLKLLVAQRFINFVISRIFRKSIVLPAERKGSTLIEENMSNLNSLIMEFLQKTEKVPEGALELFSRTMLRDKIISNEVIEEFILFMERAKKLKVTSNNYIKFAERFSYVLGGRISVENDQLYFVPSKKPIKIPFHLTSSLVKSLTPFQLYLEKVASGYDLLVMDEPEMNLHPKAQLQLLEALVAIANGLKKEDRNCVLITTHTPYFLEYLEVMLEAHRALTKQPKLRVELSQLFEVGGESALLSPEKLSVYQFTLEGSVLSVFDEESLNIDWSSFSKVSSLIPEKLWKIEELGETANA
jgi:predicted ATPase